MGIPGELPKEGKVALSIPSHGPSWYGFICGSMQNHIASFFPVFLFLNGSQMVLLANGIMLQNKGRLKKFNGGKKMPESLYARNDKWLLFKLWAFSWGQFFFFLIVYSPIMASRVTVTLAIWISFLEVLSSFLWGNLPVRMTMSTGLSARRSLSWLKVDLWSDRFRWTYWNPPNSSRPGLTDAASPAPELGAQRWGAGP